MDDISKDELLDLCRDFARTIMAMQDAITNTYNMSDEEMRDAIIFKFPIVQGTINQIALRRFGDQPTNQDNVQTAFVKVVHGLSTS